MLKTFQRPSATRVNSAFADTVVLDASDDAVTGFAPTRVCVLERRPPEAPLPGMYGAFVAGIAPRSAARDWAPSPWASARWEQEQAALSVAVQGGRRGRVAGWLQRFEDSLDRLLPGSLGSLFQLFICVSLSMALISLFLPLVDRI